MTNQDAVRIAMEQSAIDLHCSAQDFCAEENRMVLSEPDPAARVYLRLPFAANLVSYGHNIVASVSPALRDAIAGYISAFPWYHCFETPGLHALEDALAPFGMKSCFMAEYFLPDVERLRVLRCPYPIRLLTPESFGPLYTSEWSNALCAARREYDRLCAAAYDGDRLIGLAGASADCARMWQIGIDVLPVYRRRGVASALITRLSAEILARDKVPFYCAAWSNIPSVRSALRAGYHPAWVELTVRDAESVHRMNHGGEA